ncbi:MAG TPA: RNA polymerase sigma-70 factor [Candidatus Sulfomarinibacteraceae bacterium]|nr:RNA polymerase sigma-70 factor [Candidatus Sulfomarinibacteraceae bacterium]
MARSETFLEHQSLLFGIAYRMLGSVMEAEDMVQEAYLRWQAVDEAEVATPRAFLTTVVTRLCIDYLRSARVQREVYPGPWLPEPVPTARIARPDDTVAVHESLSLAYMLMLERLSPRERAAFLLRELFEYDYDELADILGTSYDNCRQLVSRARRKLAVDGVAAAPDSDREEALIKQFIGACLRGEVQSVLELLAPDATIISDGGGKAAAAMVPIHGADRVSRFCLRLVDLATPDMKGGFASLNGQTAFLIYDAGGKVDTVTLARWDGDTISELLYVRNPDKLRAVDAAAERDRALPLHEWKAKP